MTGAGFVNVDGPIGSRVPESLITLFNEYLRFYGVDPGPTERTAAFLNRVIDHRDALVWMATNTRGGEPHAAFALVYPRWSSLSRARVWQLNDLYVDPSARRSGVARAILDAIHRQALVHDVLSISLETAPDNLPAQRLYSTMGYVSSGSRLLTLTKAA